MLPSETMIWQPEFTDKTLSRKPGAVHSSYAQRKKKYPPWEKLQVEVHTRIANSE
ncbi:hypothetical protein CL8NIID57_52700 (plasmid) [Escherichia coli]|nr:hypothetical protein CL8NIID57_52700 [Escherichia coli]